MKLLKRPVVAGFVAGAALGPLVVLRDALFSSETDWAGNWWAIAALTALVVGGLLGAAIGSGVASLLARMQRQPSL